MLMWRGGGWGKPLVKLPLCESGGASSCPNLSLPIITWHLSPGNRQKWKDGLMQKNTSAHDAAVTGPFRPWGKMITLKTYKWGCSVLTSWRHGWRLPFSWTAGFTNTACRGLNSEVLSCCSAWKSSGMLYTSRIFYIVKYISRMLNNGVPHHITPMAKVLIIWSYDNWLQPADHCSFSHSSLDTGLSWALEAHSLRTEVPKPQFRAAISLISFSLLALIVAMHNLLCLPTPEGKTSRIQWVYLFSQTSSIWTNAKFLLSHSPPPYDIQKKKSLLSKWRD